MAKSLEPATTKSSTEVVAVDDVVEDVVVVDVDVVVVVVVDVVGIILVVVADVVVISANDVLCSLRGRRRQQHSVECTGNKKVLYVKSVLVVLSDASQKRKKVWPRTAENICFIPSKIKCPHEYQSSRQQQL